MILPVADDLVLRISKAKLPIVEIANCNGDRQAGQKHLL
jgi:hypothetical protein